MRFVVEPSAKSSILPLTVMAMACVLPVEKADWGSFYGSSQNTTANTAVATQSRSSKTASRFQSVGSADAPAQVDSIWAQQLQCLREALGATVLQISNALGVKRQSFYAWQRGDKTPTISNQLRIARLDDAATLLRSQFGALAPSYLNRPMIPDGKSFWQLLEANANPVQVATRVIEVANRSQLLRQRLRDATRTTGAIKPLDSNE